MKKIFDAKLMGKVQPKQRPRVFRGRAFTPKETAQYEKLVKEWASLIYRKPPSEKAVKVVMHFYMAKAKTNKKVFHTQTPDIDNLAKSVCDALNGIVLKDDCQIVELVLSKVFCEIDKQPYVSLQIFELEK